MNKVNKVIEHVRDINKSEMGECANINILSW